MFWALARTVFIILTHVAGTVEALIKIIELRKSQRDIILTLNRISIFPLQTEKQSTEVLQELNKNFIIHSELSA